MRQNTVTEKGKPYQNNWKSHIFLQLDNKKTEILVIGAELLWLEIRSHLARRAPHTQPSLPLTVFTKAMSLIWHRSLSLTRLESTAVLAPPSDIMMVLQETCRGILMSHCLHTVVCWWSCNAGCTGCSVIKVKHLNRLFLPPTGSDNHSASVNIPQGIQTENDFFV